MYAYRKRTHTNIITTTYDLGNFALITFRSIIIEHMFRLYRPTFYNFFPASQSFLFSRRICNIRLLEEQQNYKKIVKIKHCALHITQIREVKITLSHAVLVLQKWQNLIKLRKDIYHVSLIEGVDYPVTILITHYFFKTSSGWIVFLNNLYFFQLPT